MTMGLSGCLVRDDSSSGDNVEDTVIEENLRVELVEEFFQLNEFINSEMVDGASWNVDDLIALFNDQIDGNVLTIQDVKLTTESKKNLSRLEDELEEMETIFRYQPDVYRLGVYYFINPDSEDTDYALKLNEADDDLALTTYVIDKRNAKIKVGFIVYEQTEDIAPMVTDWGYITFQVEKVNPRGWLIDRMTINYQHPDDNPANAGKILEDDIPAWTTGKDNVQN
jgi:hypothetical protein